MVPEVLTLYNIFQNISLNVTPKCKEQLDAFFRNFTFAENSWALQMVDATSKVPSGILKSWNLFQMGDFQQCIDINSENIFGKYCLGHLFPKNKTLIKALFPRQLNSFGNWSFIPSFVAQNPTWALCIPHECTTNDANVLGNALLGDNFGVHFLDLLCQTREDTQRELSGGAKITLCVLAILVTITLLCTCGDIYCAYKKASCSRLIQCFSVYTNAKKIGRTDMPDPVPCLNGIRVICTIVIVFLHQCMFVKDLPLTNIKTMIDFTQTVSSMFIQTTQPFVDIFFMISGFLCIFNLLKMEENNKLNIFSYLLRRYARLTPSLVIMVLIAGTLLTYAGSGPRWPFITLYQNKCETNWWLALLYFQNYHIHMSKFCLGQTWSLNVDMHLYIVVSLTFLFFRQTKHFLKILVIYMVLSTSSCFYVWWKYQLSALPTRFRGNYEMYHHQYYVLTHTRATTWIMGVILGYYIYRQKRQNITFQIPKVFVIFLWFLSAGSVLACILCSATLLDDEDHPWINAFYLTLVAPIWCLAFTWVIFACSHNYGGYIQTVLSSPINQLLNKFTYSMYLTHTTLLHLTVGNKMVPEYFSHFNVISQFWGTLLYTFGLSVLLVFIVERPVEEMFRRGLKYKIN